MDAHLVLKGVLHPCQLPTFLTDISGVVIVEHKYGLVQKERPHYHCWVPGVFVGLSDAAKEPFKLKVREYYNNLIPDLNWSRNSNAYYSFIKHDSFERWLDYVYLKCDDCKSPTIICWNRSDPRPDSPGEARSFDDLIIPTNVVTETPVVVPPVPPKKKKDPAHIRLYNYCVDKGAFEPSMEEVANYWAEMTGGAYELRYVTGPIKYAFYKLNNYDPRIKAAFVREIMRVLPEIIL